MLQNKKIKILIAPLDWGLGHATRCIPLIKHLLQSGCKIVIATDGKQEKLLKTEFPSLLFVTLPGYKISYSNNKRFFLIKIILQLPKILKAVRNEKKWLSEYMNNNPVDAIISDNRYGLYHPAVPSVFITHQLTIKAPFAFAEKFIRKINYRFIEKFSECWVPDLPGGATLAADLSHPIVLPKIPVRYLGGLSRLQLQENIQQKYHLLIIISGPEPQRTLMENKVLEQIQDFKGQALMVRGLPGDAGQIYSKEELSIVNHLPAKELELVFNASEYIISRSGYTSIMDICKLKKKSVLIPTPGQTEQEYLAKHLHNQGWCFSVQQDEFRLTKVLEQAKNFEYRLPDLNMEEYKMILNGLLESL